MAASPGGNVVGRVSVRVLPDTSGFGTKLKAYLEGVERKLKVVIPMELDYKSLRADLAQAKARLAADGDDAVKIKVHADTSSVVRDFDALTRSARRSSGQIMKNLDFKPVSRSLASVRSVMDNLSITKWVQLDHVIAQMVIFMSRWVALAGLLGPPLLLAAAAAQALAPALAVALPVLGAIAAGVAVVTLGMDTLLGAKGKGGDRVGGAFQVIREQIQGLKKDVGEALVKGLGPSIERFATSTFPVLTDGLVQFAAAMNDAMGKLLKFATAGETLTNLKTLFAGMSRGTLALNQAIVPLSTALLQIAVAAVPGFVLLAEAIARAATAFAAWTTQASKSGAMKAIISTATRDLVTSMRMSWQIIKATIGVLYELEPAARIVFGALGRGALSALKWLSQTISSVTAWVRSFESAQPAVVGLVAGLAQVIAAVRATATAVVGWLVPVLLNFGKAIAPGFMAFAQRIGDAFATIWPAIQRFAAAVAPVIEDFAAKLGETLGPALAQIGTVIKDDLAPAFAALLPAITPVVKWLLGFLGDAVIGALTGVVNVVKGALKIIAGLFNVIAGVLTGDWSMAWNGLKQITSGAWDAIKGIIQAAWNIGILKPFKSGWMAIKGFFTSGWKGIAAGATGAFRSLKTSILNGLKSAGESIKSFAPVRSFGDVWTAVKLSFEALGGFFSKVGKNIVSALQTVALRMMYAWDGVVAFFTRNFAEIKSAFSQFRGALSSAWNAVVGVFNGALRGLGGSLSRFRAAIDEMVLSAYVRFLSLQNTIRAAMSAARSALSTGWNAIVGFFRAGVQGIGKVLSGLRDAIGSGIQRAVAGMRNIGTGIFESFTPGFRAFIVQIQELIAQLVARFQALRTQLTAVWDTIVVAWRMVSADIAAVFTTVRNAVNTGIQAAATAMRGVVSRIAGSVATGFQAFVAQLQAFIAPAVARFQAFRAAVAVIWNAVVAAFRAGVTRIGAVLTSLGARATSAWNFVSGAFNAGLRRIGAVLSSMRNAISEMVVAAYTRFLQLANYVSSAMSRVASAASAGMARLRSAVSAGFDRAVSLASAFPGHVVAAIGGLAGLLYSTGVNLIQGLINGIQAMAGRAGDAAVAAVQGAVNRARSFLRIGSPSKLARDQIGKWLALGIAVGIKDSASKIDSQMKTLLRMTMKTSNRAAVRIAREARKELSSLAAQRDAVSESLKESQKKLKDIKKEALQQAQQAKQAIVESGNITQGEAGFQTAGSITANLKNALATAKKFSAALIKLRKAGLNSTALEQIVNAGPDQGLATATAILQGGRGAVTQINALQKQLIKTGGKVGKTVSDVMFTAGLDAAKGLVAGLTKERNAIAKAMKQVARQLVKDLKRELGIKSPSRVMRDEVGKWTVLGVAEGVRENAGAVSSALRSAVSMDMPSAGAGNAVPTGSGPGVHIGAVYAWDEREAARRIDDLWRKAMVQYQMG